MKDAAQTIHLVECPRDAMQGWKRMIPTKDKIRYINKLLEVGFHTIDFGSFVSPKAIPQMADTKEVLKGLRLKSDETKLLAIVANKRGAEEAGVFEEITYLGFPFSISPTFQKRNTNSTIEQSLETVKIICNICAATSKQPVIYISMAFGNPYDDRYEKEIVLHWIDRLVKIGITIISLADTVGVANHQQIRTLVKAVKENYHTIETGVHLHSTSKNWRKKLEAAYKAGATRFDGALKGIGGCPMANDELVGNMDSSLMINYFLQKELLPDLDQKALRESLAIADEIFSN
jgi:hydroxymethylglutaryl-CoA lyase